MPRVARKPLIDEAPGLPARTPAQAQVRDRRLPREREAAERRAMGFPPGRTPDEAIAPSCRCSTSTAGCGCPAPRNPEDSILRGKELGVPTRPLWERVLTGAELGVPVKPWWERVVEMPAKPGRHPEPAPAPTPAFGRLLKTPTLGEGPPGAPPPNAPCGPLWEALVADPPVDDAGMPAVTRPEQLDFGDIPAMEGALDRRDLGTAYWYTANASFVYRLLVRSTSSSDPTPVSVFPNARWRIPRCFDGEWIPVVPTFALLVAGGSRYLVFPAGLRAELGLVIGHISGPAAATISWSHVPPSDPSAFERMTKPDDEAFATPPDLPQNGVLQQVRIALNEEFVFVSRGSAGVAVFAAPGIPPDIGSPWQFLGHQRQPVWANSASAPDGPWGATRLAASRVVTHEAADGPLTRRVLVVGLRRALGPAAQHAMVAVYDVSNASAFAAGLKTDPLSPAATSGWWRDPADPGIATAASEGSSSLAGVVALPPTGSVRAACVTPSAGCDVAIGPMVSVQGLDVASMPGSRLGGPDSSERSVALVSNAEVVWAVDLTPILNPSKSTSPLPTLPQLLVDGSPRLVTAVLGSFAVSGGTCDDLGTVGPGLAGFADADYPTVLALGNVFATLCGRYALTGWQTPDGGNALQLLAMDYTPSFGSFTLRKIGEARPRMDGPQNLEANAACRFDPIGNLALATSRGRYGLAAFVLPPQSEAATAVAKVGAQPVAKDEWYPDSGSMVPCSAVDPTLRAPTSAYRQQLQPQLLPMRDWSLFGSPAGQLPYNLDAAVYASSYMGPDASSQRWLRVGFAYEFLGGAAATSPDGSRDVLFLADRMNAALWAFAADPLTSPALDVFGWIWHAYDTVVAGSGHAPNTSVVVATGTLESSLVFLSWDWTTDRFVELGRLLAVSGNFDEGSGPGYRGRAVHVRKLAGLGGDPSLDEAATHVAATTHSRPRGPATVNCHDHADVFLVEVEPVVQRLTAAAGADHGHHSPSPDPSNPAWWTDDLHRTWLLPPWYDPASPGDSDPANWSAIAGGPLPWTRLGLGRDLLSDGSAWNTWLPGRTADDPEDPGGWETGNALLEDIVGHGDHAFAIMRMITMDPAHASPSEFWMLVLTKAPVASVGESLPEEPSNGWCGAANGTDIIRRVGPEVTGPLSGVAVRAWHVVGPPGADALRPIAAIPLGSVARHDESSSIEVDPAGRYVVAVSGSGGCWVIHLGTPGQAGYAQSPVVVAGLRGTGAVQTATGSGGKWFGWNADEDELNEPLILAATATDRSNDDRYPVWPLDDSLAGPPEDSVPGPPWRSSALARPSGPEGPLLLFLNTSPLTAWSLEDLPDNPGTPPPNPLNFLGALCTRTPPALGRDRATIVSHRAVWFAGTGGGIAIPLCGPGAPATCCGPTP